MKSLCIKTNNSNLLQYLLNEFNHIDLENIYFSCHEFKHYKNIIIHYTGENTQTFLDKISFILSLLVIDELEESFLKRLLFQNYFYFDTLEQNEILNLCFDIMANDLASLFDKKMKILSDAFYSYISKNKTILLPGFINFRIKEYFKVLDNIVNEAVNQYLIEKEYMEFISLLKLYINSQNANCNIVHLIYSSNDSILLDENKEIISVSMDSLNAKYLSDISFSANDYTLNSLLTLIPKKIYIHLIDNFTDEFITTLQSVFGNRISICTDCNICNLYNLANKPVFQDNAQKHK